MDKRTALIIGSFILFAGCGLNERLSTKAVRDDKLGIYLRVPKNWTSATEGDALTITDPSGIKVKITSTTRPAQSEVLGTDQYSADLIRELKKSKYEAELLDGWRLNGFYTRTVKAVKDDEIQVVWVTSIPQIVTVYELRITGKKNILQAALPQIESVLRKEFRFTKINSILLETPFWTITTADYGGYMFWLLVIICIIFMGRYFFIDLWRLIRMPADVFRDLARGEGFIYPIFWILLAAFLAGAIYGTLLPGEIAKMEQRVASQAEGVRPTVKGMTTDPYLQELLVQDVRERAVQPIISYLDAVLFYIPVVVLAAWLVFGLLLFIVVKILRGKIALFATIKAVTILFAIWSLAGGLVYAGLARENSIQQYVGYALAAWGLVLILIMLKEIARVNFAVGLVAVAICAGAVGYGLNYLKTSQFEPVQVKMRAALSPNRQLVDQFNTPFTVAPAATPAPSPSPPAPTSPGPGPAGRGY